MKINCCHGQDTITLPNRNKAVRVGLTFPANDRLLRHGKLWAEILIKITLIGIINELWDRICMLIHTTKGSRLLRGSFLFLEKLLAWTILNLPFSHLVVVVDVLELFNTLVKLVRSTHWLLLLNGGAFLLSQNSRGHSDWWYGRVTVAGCLLYIVTL